MDTEHILEGLFKWTHDFLMVDSMGEPVTAEDPTTGEQVPIRVYQRIVGDAEVARSREAALRASALKRTELRDPTNLDRLLLIPEFDRLEKDDLVSLALLSEIGDMRDEARRDLRFPYPAELKSDATLEQQEEHQRLEDTFFDRRNEAIKEDTQKLIEQRQVELTSFNRNRIEQIYEDVVINNAAKEAMMTTFNEMMTYLATYNDPKLKKRSFTSYSTFKNANTEVKRQLIEGYLRLEVGGDNLKK